MAAVGSKFFFACAFVLLIVSTAYASVAPVPIFDFSTEVSNKEVHPERANRPISQRIAILSQRMDNYGRLHLSDKLEMLVQQLAKIQGQLEVQEHAVQLLREQQQHFYQDLDKRLNRVRELTDQVGRKKGLVSPLVKSGSSVRGLYRGNVQKAWVRAAGGVSPLLKHDDAAYQSAFNLLKAKRYTKAIKAYKQFIIAYPESRYVVNAYYWLGEVYFLQSDLQKAKEAFNSVVNRYPRTAKVPDALLKLAMIAERRGQISSAQQTLRAIRHKFSGSSAARLADLRLKGLEKRSQAS